MAKLFALFNVLAGGASIAGLCLTLQFGYRNYGLLSIFVLTALMSTYVLFVPANKIEQNVRSKIERYLSPDGGALAIQRGEIELDMSSIKDVEFDLPFVSEPKVELIFKSGSQRVLANIDTTATPHAAKFRPKQIISSSDRATFTWVARGRPLEKQSD